MATNLLSTLPATDVIGWVGRSKISTPADGVVLLTNDAGTSAGGFKLGGATSSFPYIKRNSAGIDFRVADDSAYAAIAALSLTLGTPLTAANGGTGLSAMAANVVSLLGAADYAAMRAQLGLTALATTAPGTGVATALEINTNTAGGVLTHGGAGNHSTLTLSDLLTITQGTANAGILASTGYSLTGSSATNGIDISGTWNTSGSPTLIKANVTNTASGGSAMLVDIRRDNVSRLSLDVFGNGTISSQLDVGTYFRASSSGSSIKSDHSLAWTTGNASGTKDTAFVRAAANIIGLTNASTGGGAMQFTEMTAPSAGATNTVRLYAEDNGSGKTRLMAIFPTGAAQQVAIEP
jgi:hypothetical protein